MIKEILNEIYKFVYDVYDFSRLKFLLIISVNTLSCLAQSFSLLFIYPYIISLLNNETYILDISHVIKAEFNTSQIFIIVLSLLFFSAGATVLSQYSKEYYIYKYLGIKVSQFFDIFQTSNYISYLKLDQGNFLQITKQEFLNLRSYIEAIISSIFCITNLAIFTITVTIINAQDTIIFLILSFLIVVMILPISKILSKESKLNVKDSSLFSMYCVNTFRTFKYNKVNYSKSYLKDNIKDNITPPLQRIRNISLWKNLLIEVTKILYIIMILVFVTLSYYFSEVEVEYKLATFLIFIRMIPDFRKLIDNYNKCIPGMISIKTINEFQSQIIIDPDKNDLKLDQIQNITLNNISFKFNKKRIISDLTYTFNKGKIYSVSGASGIGKTTLIDLIVGLLSPDKGSIKYDAINTKYNNNIRDIISYYTQEFEITKGSVIKFLKRGIKELKDSDISKMIKYFELDMDDNDFINKKLVDNGENLSGGQKQRLGLCKAILKESPIIILDEPTSALNKDLADKLMSYLIDIKDKHIIIIITHNKDLINKCDADLNLIKQNHYTFSKD